MDSNHVQSVTIVVELKSGDRIEFGADGPGPLGDNPRFMRQQAESGIAEVADRVLGAISGAYSGQIEK